MQVLPAFKLIQYNVRVLYYPDVNTISLAALAIFIYSIFHDSCWYARE